MNSLQLAQRLSRNLSVDDPANPSADALLDVLAAANAGIAAFYRELPAIYRRTTVSATLKQPQALNVVFQAKYSNKVGADTFSAGMFGCTVRLGQGPTDNIVTGSFERRAVSSVAAVRGAASSASSVELLHGLCRRTVCGRRCQFQRDRST
jgi:hypothetical protein